LFKESMMPRQICKGALFAMILALVPAHAAAQSTRETIDGVLPKVVKIFGAGGIANLHAYGTGFIVSPEGHIATVWSHVLDTTAVTVVLDDGRRFYAEVLGAEPALDVAVIKIDAENLPYFDLDDLGRAGPGTRVLGFSNMFKVAEGDEPVSVLHGVIAATTTLSARRGRYEVPYTGDVYIVDAITNNPGAAGGVLTSYQGELLGMIGRELRNQENNTWINYAIPVEALRQTIRDIQEGVFRPQETEEADEPLNDASLVDLGIVLVPDVIYRTPAYVDTIIEGSPAAEAGLEPDDLVVFINNELVHSIRQLEESLSRLEPGEEFNLVIRRGRTLITVPLVIPES
jgi:serine protease Do